MLCGVYRIHPTLCSLSTHMQTRAVHTEMLETMEDTTTGQRSLTVAHSLTETQQDIG